MRYKKIAPKNDQWTRTCQALKELFETLRCSKCKNSLHDPQQFLPCGHFSCFSCIKNSNKCIECHFSVSDDILKDDTVRKIVQACCTIAAQVGFKELPKNTGTTSKERPVIDQSNSTNNLDSHLNNASRDPSQQKKPGRKRKGSSEVAATAAKKAKPSKTIPSMRIPKNVDKKNHHGETKLQEECKRGHVENVKLLLSAGADPNTACAAGWTPLQECADFGYIELAKLLLDKGADINKKGYDGRTPLHEAVQAGHFSMVEFLLKNNALRDVEDNNHNKPIKYCKSEKMKMLLKGNTKNGSPGSSRQSRNTSVPRSRMYDNDSGVSSSAQEDNASASKTVKVEKDCDTSSSDSEDDGESYHREVGCSQNLTITHASSCKDAAEESDKELIDTEEIDILN